MNNNDYVNLLTTIAHEKGKDRKLLLKMEIAKATDPLVKEQLQLLLEEQESQERRNKFIAGIFFAVLFVAFILVFMKWIFYPNNDIKTNAASSTTASTVASTTEGTLFSSENNLANETKRNENSKNNTVNPASTNLSETEAIDWAKSYLYGSGEFTQDTIDRLLWETTIGEDNLINILARGNVLAAWLRINENGELQRTTDVINGSNWQTASVSYTPYTATKKETLTTNLSEEEAIAWIKSYLYDSGNMHLQAIDHSDFISEVDQNNFFQVTVHSNNRLTAIFRIDGNGDLQETRDFAYLSDWKTVRTAQDYDAN